ncbi:MAG: DUF2141 domain-containing protein [Flavobacteriales bacterium]
MKRYISSLSLSALFIGSLVLFDSCKKDKDDDNNAPPQNITQPIDTTGNNNNNNSIVEHINITVTGIRDIVGTMNVALYNNASSFNNPNQAYKQLFIPVNATSMTMKFDSIPPGEYAFGLFHDENNNQVLDQNFLGIPKEGFAFSNNAMGTFGPPSWNQSKFTLPVNNYISQSVQLRFY